MDLEKQLLQAVGAYLKSKEKAWSASTLKSETSRLMSIVRKCPELYNNPEALWEALQAGGSYTRQTTWVRASCFVDHLIKHSHIEGPNQLVQWREANANLFKNKYQRKTTSISIDEARVKICSIENTAIRTKCLQLLDGGLRYTESLTLRDGTVRGKGNKTRKVYVDPVTSEPTYWAVYSSLKEVGLTPHMLRKIKATAVSKAGARPEQLCELFGWSSFNTAQSYLNAGTDEELKEIMQ